MTESYPALWRSSAHEAVKNDDLPECLAVLPELVDGSIGQGKATKVLIHIELFNNGEGLLVVSDNGGGIKNIQRLLSWADRESTDLHHRYGFGSKKCLTKWCRDYDSKWSISYRNCDKKGVSGSLWVYESPFMGTRKHFIEDDHDETTLMPSGTEWRIHFKTEILGKKYESVESLFSILKEILRTRYSKKYFEQTDFQIKVESEQKKLFESSKENKWRTFEEVLMDEVERKIARIEYQKEFDFDMGVKMRYVQYKIKEDGRSNFELKNEFPTYGNKNQKCARMYIGISGRNIEISPIWNFYLKKDETTKDTHNDFNGQIGIIDFYSTNDLDNHQLMPTPCTTKVSFDSECKNFQKCLKMIRHYHKETPIITSPKKSLVKEDKNKSPSSLPVILSSPIVNGEMNVEKKEDKITGNDEGIEKKEEIKEKMIQLKNSPQKISKKIPSTIKQNKPTKIIEKKKTINTEVWDKYIGKEIPEHKCLCCKQENITTKTFIPRKIKVSDEDSINNLRPICKSCNQDMGNMNMDTYVLSKNYLFG